MFKIMIVNERFKLSYYEEQIINIPIKELFYVYDKGDYKRLVYHEVVYWFIIEIRAWFRRQNNMIKLWLKDSSCNCGHVESYKEFYAYKFLKEYSNFSEIETFLYYAFGGETC